VLGLEEADSWLNRRKPLPLDARSVLIGHPRLFLNTICVQANAGSRFLDAIIVLVGRWKPLFGRKTLSQDTKVLILNAEINDLHAEMRILDAEMIFSGPYTLILDAEMYILNGNMHILNAEMCILDGEMHTLDPRALISASKVRMFVSKVKSYASKARSLRLSRRNLAASFLQSESCRLTSISFSSGSAPKILSGSASWKRRSAES
jgi:hypothetical protein